MKHTYKLIGCEILFREICYCASVSANVIDLDFMPKGLHDVGEEKMSTALQERIDAVDTDRYEAILLCYGLCNYGTKGLRSSLPIVIPRAHDCITLLMGSKETYKDYFFANPGTLYMSSGWIERAKDPGEVEHSLTAKFGMRGDFAEYDDDDAEYLRSILGDWVKNYSKYAYIDTGVGGPASGYEAHVLDMAKEKGWKYEKVPGDTSLLQALMDGQWDQDRFLYVPPSRTITATYGDDIVGVGD